MILVMYCVFTGAILAQGSTPPEFKPGQVDIMWAVVPKNIVKDNFGDFIATRYYCVEVVIGNNSEYDLQIAQVGFKNKSAEQGGGVINVIMNPFAGDMSKSIPDKSLALLFRFNDQILREGAIFKSNRQSRTRTFIPKEMLRLKKEQLDDPGTITQALGEIFVVGRRIQYLDGAGITLASQDSK